MDASSNAGTELGTQSSPFKTVQAAIDAASPGDEIRVAAGTYVENLRIAGKAITLNGGYSSTWTRDRSANQTTLSGEGDDAVINLIGSDATIDGFRITGGAGSTNEVPFGYHGGGIYSTDGSPTISNNTIEGNDVRKPDEASDYHFGGGIYVTNAPDASIVNNVVRGNYAGRGGGIAVVGEHAVIQGNTVEDNVAIGDHGGGLFLAVRDALITRNVIRGNEVGRDLGYGWGGGLIFLGVGNSAEISFNEVYENFAAAYGSGEFIDEGGAADIHHELVYRNVSKAGCEAVSAIAVDGGEGVGSEATISHCTVVGNVCENATRGNGLQVEGMSVVTVTNSIFWNNGGDDFAVFETASLSVEYTCSEEAFVGVGNLNDDPRFVNEGADDYHLAADSPCIDAGDPASPFDQETDSNGRADMGRYGNAPADESVTPSDDDDPVDDPDPVDDVQDDVNSDDPSDSGADDSDDATSDDNSESPDDAAGDSDPLEGAAAGLCPLSAPMLLSLSLIGARRRPRRRSDSPSAA